MNIALYGREIDKKWDDKISILLKSFKEKKINISYFSELYESLKERIPLPLGEVFTNLAETKVKIDLFLTLGGDGTFLSSLTHVKDSQIPILGVNFGRLGFLTSAEIKEGNNEWLNSLLNNKFEMDKRPVLELTSNLPITYPFALNEIYIHRIGSSMMSIDVWVDGVLLPRYWADGILIATPTGSTAYSLSIGGPIVTLDANIFVLSPISPHNLNVRPMIISDDSAVEIEISSKDSEAMISLDNRHYKLGSSKKIKISKANFKLNSVSFSKSDFFTALSNKLFWGKDERNMQKLK